MGYYDRIRSGVEERPPCFGVHYDPHDMTDCGRCDDREDCKRAWRGTSPTASRVIRTSSDTRSKVLTPGPSSSIVGSSADDYYANPGERLIKDIILSMVEALAETIAHFVRTWRWPTSNTRRINQDR